MAKHFALFYQFSDSYWKSGPLCDPEDVEKWIKIIPSDIPHIFPERIKGLASNPDKIFAGQLSDWNTYIAFSRQVNGFLKRMNAMRSKEHFEATKKFIKIIVDAQQAAGTFTFDWEDLDSKNKVAILTDMCVGATKGGACNAEGWKNAGKYGGLLWRILRDVASQEPGAYTLGTILKYSALYYVGNYIAGILKVNADVPFVKSGKKLHSGDLTWETEVVWSLEGKDSTSKYTSGFAILGVDTQGKTSYIRWMMTELAPRKIKPEYGAPVPYFSPTGRLGFEINRVLDPNTTVDMNGTREGATGKSTAGSTVRYGSSSGKSQMAGELGYA